MMKKILLMSSAIILAACSSEPAQTTDVQLENTIKQEINNLPDDVTATYNPENGAVVIAPDDLDNKSATFGIKPDEFRKLFALKAKELGLGDNQLPEFSIENGAVNDTFTATLTDAVALIGSVDKPTGEIKGLTYMMGKTDQGDTEGMFLVTVGSVTAQILNPDQPKKNTGGAVVNLFTDVLKQYGSGQTGEAEKVVGDVKYYALANDVTGLWIGFEPKS